MAERLQRKDLETKKKEKPSAICILNRGREEEAHVGSEENMLEIGDRQGQAPRLNRDAAAE